MVKKSFKEELEKIRNNIGGRSKILFGKDIYIPRPHVATIYARDLNDLYNKTVNVDLEHGDIQFITEGSHAGEHRVQFKHVTLIAENQRDEYGNLAPESRLGLPPPTDEKAIQNYFNDYLISRVLGDKEHYRYSTWVVGLNRNLPLSHKEVPRGTRFNQLEWCAKHFTEKGFGNNHCYITVGCAEDLQRYDWEYKHETERGTTECLRGLSLKINGDKLDLTSMWRSWNLMTGTPENLGGISLLMEYFCNLVNIQRRDSQQEIKPGVLIANSDGLHIYEHALDMAKLKAGLK